MLRNCLILLLNVYLIKLTHTHYASIDDIYAKGIGAYNHNLWPECVIHFEEVNHLYKLFKSIWSNCRLNCNSDLKTSHIKDKIEDLKLYETLIERKFCLQSCSKKGFDQVKLIPEISDNVLNVLKNSLQYKYLHECYHKVDDATKAASALYTYLIVNPFDINMVEKLQFYMTQPEIKVKDIIDFDNNDYPELYKIGMIAYNLGNWGETIAAMEEVITDYLLAENNCRAECQELNNQVWASEFIVKITEDIKEMLQCKQRCQNKLKLLKFDSGVQFLADVLNYLQISYYHTDRLKDAVNAMASYLLMFPQDVDMIENKKIYLTIVDTELFVERSEIYYYYKRDIYERYLLDRIQQNENITM